MTLCVPMHCCPLHGRLACPSRATLPLPFTPPQWRPSGEYACPGEPTDVFRSRLLALKRWIEDRPEHTLALVTHWGVARGLTGQSLHNCELVKTNTTALLMEPKIDRDE